MTVLPDFVVIAEQAIDHRKSMQQRNAAARDDIAAVLQAAHAEDAPWKAVPPGDEIEGNVTKRLNVSCGATFRLHFVIFDGGRVLFPKVEGTEPFTADDSAQALVEIARRYAFHRMPDEAVVSSRSMQIR